MTDYTPIKIMIDGLGGAYVMGHWPMCTVVDVNVPHIREALGMVAPRPLRDGVIFNVDNGRAEYELRHVQANGCWLLELKVGRKWWPFQPGKREEYRMLIPEATG